MHCKSEQKLHQHHKKAGAKLKASEEAPKTKYACIVESHESTRQRVELSVPKFREAHVAGRGLYSMNHYHLVHTFIPMPQAMKIRDAKEGPEKARGNFSMAVE